MMVIGRLTRVWNNKWRVMLYAIMYLMVQTVSGGRVQMNGKMDIAPYNLNVKGVAESGLVQNDSLEPLKQSSLFGTESVGISGLLAKVKFACSFTRARLKHKHTL